MALTTINFTLPDLVGDSGSGGVHGLAPAPASGDAAAGKYLKADGTWETPPSSGGTVTDVTATLPLLSTGGATPDISAETSLGGNDVADAGKLLIFNTEGQIQGSNVSSGLAAVKGTSTGNGYAVHGDASTATAVVANSNSGNGIDASSISLVAITAITFGPTNPVLTVKNANAANTAPLGRFWRNDNTGLTINNNGSLAWTSANGARDTRLNALPSVAANASKVLAVNVGETDVEWKVLTATDVGADPAGSAAAAQAFAIQRSNHTGTQTSSTISDFNSAARAQTEAELIAGTNVTITPAGSGATRTLTIAASGGASSMTIRTYTGTTDTLVLTDAGNMVRGNNAAANVITVPLNASVAFPIGSQVLVSQYGAGQTSFTPEGGVTINSGGAALKIAIRYGCAVLTKTDTNEWNLEGNLAI